MTRLSVIAGALLAGFVLTACETLPHDGPAARAVQEQAGKGGGYAIVDLDYGVTQTLAAHRSHPLATLAPASSAAPIDRLGEGDILSVSVFEAATGPAGPAGEGRGAQDRSQGFSGLEVDAAGQVAIPFAGAVRVAGLTRAQAAEAIRKALSGRYVNPQVLVTTTANVSNSVTVMGEARNPGRFALSASNDRLLDVLAQAGGAAKPSQDTVVTVARGAQSVSTTLAALLADSGENIRLAPRDQIRLIYKPRRYSTFGALAHPSQTLIEDESLSLAGALSRIGGLDPAAANASQVMVFRFERPEAAAALNLPVAAAAGGTPVIYRLNLRSPQGYFIAGKFEIEPDDLIYAPRADSAELKSFFDLVSSITRVAYDVSVSSAIR